ncbi:MAG TPA: putative quinol monooxygenase [Candidatus Lustribacter sp.]|jgi:quinol monooxygenase YgiN|nr:putative quinol monooxygenase [Candidatus Lustribacter sp.]
MLVQAVIYTVPADKVDEAIGVLRSLRDGSRGEAGCVCFDVSQSVDDAGTFVLYEEWRDQDALDVHYKTVHFNKFGINGIRTLAVNRVAHRCQPLE